MTVARDDLADEERAARAEALTVAADVLAGRVGQATQRDSLVGHTGELLVLARYIVDGTTPWLTSEAEAKAEHEPDRGWAA